MGRFVFILTFIVNKCRLCSVALRTQSLAKLLRKCFTRRIVYTENPDSHLHKKWAKTKAVESTSNCQKKRQIRMDKWTQGTQCCLFLVAYKQKPCLKYKNNTCFFTLISRYGRYNNVTALVDTNVDLYFFRMFRNASSYSWSQILIINAPKRVMLHYSDQTTNFI